MLRIAMKNTIFSILFCCFTASSVAQFLTVDDTYTAQQLVENVLINSPCANVSDIRVSGDTFSGGQQSYGYFNSGASGFPFADGIILSTARAKLAEGPNATLIDEGNSGWAGDPELEQVLNINNTVNATSLEFDFTPLTSQISFDYIFASEEYHDDAQCTYSDGFAFLLKEANSPNPYQNLAVIPNTNTPVLVTTVHPAVPGVCPAVNETYFGNYNGSGSPINFNGQTAVLTAKATVIPGRTYHIRLVIADQGNTRYDSAIFLGGGSFKVGSDLGPDLLIATNNPVCDGETYILDATEAGTNSYQWYKNNNPILGAVLPTYNVTAAGDYKVEITLGTSACIASGEVTVEYVPIPVLSNTTVVQCDEDRNGSALFNLRNADNIIRNGDTSLGPVAYYPNLLAAQNRDGSQLINNPEAYPSGAGTVYASVTSSYGCSSVASVTLQLSNNPVPSMRDFESCDLDGNIDGYYQFNLSDIDPMLLQGLPSGLVVEYYQTQDDAILQRDRLPTLFTNTTIYQMYIYARIVNGPDCYGLVPVHLYVNNNSPANFGDQTIVLCEDGSVDLAVSNEFSTYSWSNGDSTHQTTVTQAGEYTVTVSDANTCLATKKFLVVLAESPRITTVDVEDFNENGSTVLVHFSGNDSYEFSIDGVNFQTSPYFANVSPGNYTVMVRGKCGEDSRTIQVLDYPKYFTPNGDGYNDVWQIDNLPFDGNTSIRIFDRLGKLVHEIRSAQSGWDGKLNTRPLPATDYWFVIQLENNRLIRGHFALKR